MSRIFVRERRHAGEGAGRPRFAIVAVEGSELKVFKTRVRKSELDKIAEVIGADVVYLPRGENHESDEEGSGSSRGRRSRRRGQEED